MDALDEKGKPFFSSLFEFAKHNGLPLHWGSRGFSINANKEGTHVAIGFGYPPQSVYRQSFYTTLVGPGGMQRKVDIPDQVIAQLYEQTEAAGIFAKAGKELKIVLDGKYEESKALKTIELLKSYVKAVEAYDIK